MALRQRWHKVDKSDALELSDAVFAAVRYIDDNWGNARRLRNRKYVALYENREMAQELAGIALPSMPTPGALTLNVCQSCVDALGSKILTNKPKPQYVTVDGDFSEQQMAKMRQRFIMGNLLGEKVYTKGQDAGLDCMIQDIGAVKLFAAGKKRIGYERVDPNELLVDERAARNGDPRELFQRKLVPTDVLIARHPKLEEQIEAAASLQQPHAEDDPTGDLGDDQVEVVEGWHLPSGDGAADGRHVIVVRGAVLLDEGWKDTSFPFAFLRWNKLRNGFFGQGLVEQLDAIQVEITTLLRKIRDAHNLLGVPWVISPTTSTVKKGAITNKIGEIIDANLGQEPKVVVHQVISPEIYQHLIFLFEKAFEISGISQLSASSRKPAGIESGVALRTLLDTETQRFALFVDAWQEFFLELARQTQLQARRMGDARAVYRHKEWAREISWSDVDDGNDEKYVLQLWPVNLLPDTPSGKLAYVEQMMTMGLLSPDQGQALLDFPDLEAFQRTHSAGRELIEHIVEFMLTEPMGRAYIAPTKYMPLMNPDGSPGVGIQIVQGALCRGQMDGWPTERLALLQQWLDEAAAIATAGQAPAPAGPPPGGAQVPVMNLPAGMTPGAPPMPGPMAGPPPGPLPPELAGLPPAI